MSYAKLRGKIREVFGTQEAFAVAMGMSTVTLSQKLNGKLEWKTSEIANACDLLGIPLKIIQPIFLSEKLRNLNKVNLIIKYSRR